MIIEFIIGWLVFSILAGVYPIEVAAVSVTFVVALILSPLVGFIIVLINKPLPTAAEREAAEADAANSKTCPFCLPRGTVKDTKGRWYDRFNKEKDQTKRQSRPRWIHNDSQKGHVYEFAASASAASRSAAVGSGLLIRTMIKPTSGLKMSATTKVTETLRPRLDAVPARNEKTSQPMMNSMITVPRNFCSD